MVSRFDRRADLELHRSARRPGIRDEPRFERHARRLAKVNEIERLGLDAEAGRKEFAAARDVGDHRHAELGQLLLVELPGQTRGLAGPADPGVEVSSALTPAGGDGTNYLIVGSDTREGIDETDLDRVVLDLPEPWQVVPHAAKALRSGGIYLSFVPTVPQITQTVEALERATVFGMVHTFETLLRTWSVQGRSVRPDHRMVAHSGFITVARKIEPGLLSPTAPRMEAPEGPGADAFPPEDEELA